MLHFLHLIVIFKGLKGRKVTYYIYLDIYHFCYSLFLWFQDSLWHYFSSSLRSSFSVSFRTGLLVPSSSFPSAKNVFICHYSRRFLLDIEFGVDDSFFCQHLEVILLSLASMVFDEKSIVVQIVSLCVLCNINILSLSILYIYYIYYIYIWVLIV